MKQNKNILLIMKTTGKRVVSLMIFAALLCSNVYAVKSYSLVVKDNEDRESIFKVDPSLVIRVNAGALEIESKESVAPTLYLLTDVKEFGYKEESGSGIYEARIDAPSVYLSGSLITITSPNNKTIEYTLTDINGMVVEKGYVEGSKAIDTTHYRGGVYMLKADNHKGLKFIVR